MHPTLFKTFAIFVKMFYVHLISITIFHCLSSGVCLQSKTLGDRQGRSKHAVVVTSKTTDSLDSKLSPRAYPSTAPRPAKMALDGRSAFQKVSPEVVDQSQMDFYNTNFSYYANRSNNSNNSNNNDSNSDARVSRSNQRSRDQTAQGEQVK